jgi:NitT/TauT family transport system permease protein
VKRNLLTLLTFAAVLAALEVAGRNGAWDTRVLPLPSEVAAYIADAFTDGARRDQLPAAVTANATAATLGTATSTTAASLWTAFAGSTLTEALLVTLKRLVSGYLIGFLAGIPLGLLTARFNFFRETFGLVALGMQGLPSVCWVPLALIWFRPTENAILFVVVMGTVWSLMLATEHGVRTVPPLYVRAARTMGSRGLHLWWRVLLPAALPAVIGGMKQSWAFAWRSLMAAEIYVTILTGCGLGWLLHNGREVLRMDQVMGVMLIIVIVGLTADRILFAPAENRIRARWGLDKN